MSAKDRVLLESAPHLVLDGALAAAAAIGAALDRRSPSRDDAAAARSALDDALRERGGERRVSVAGGAGRLPRGRGERADRLPRRRPALPTVVPPRPFERGLRRRPTLVQNPETLAHIALIARHGPDVVPRRSGPGTIRARRWSRCPARSRRAASRRSSAARRSRRSSARRSATRWSRCAPSSSAATTASGSRATRSRPSRSTTSAWRRHGGEPRRRGDRRPRPVGVPRAGDRPRDRLARRAERRPVRPVQQRAAGDRRAARRDGRGASAPGRAPQARALER